MPNMASIVVKKADGTTNYTLEPLSAASGDGGHAQWRGTGAMPSLAPNLRVKSQWNGPRTARRVEVSGDYPYVASVSGQDTVVSRVSYSFSFLCPQNMPSSVAADAAAIVANAIASSLIKDSLSSGFAPT